MSSTCARKFSLWGSYNTLEVPLKPWLRSDRWQIMAITLLMTPFQCSTKSKRVLGKHGICANEIYQPWLVDFLTIFHAYFILLFLFYLFNSLWWISMEEFLYFGENPCLWFAGPFLTIWQRTLSVRTLGHCAGSLSIIKDLGVPCATVAKWILKGGMDKILVVETMLPMVVYNHAWQSTDN